MSTSDVGDGDHCPTFPEHGRMIHLKSDTARQYCPHSDHDGKPKQAQSGPIDPTRQFWPTGIDSFPAAVREARRETDGQSLDSNP
jgi:hypothetical protein